ncbi:MFS transporter [Paludibacterium paludis]|uniref:MFS transporter n=1 Tax=Paludibacterium paludis TaxID=1225769 RepID=A0A918P6Q3_9NEIS|nr:MFS transporter [Paludibacterium paludis]GGY27488.1 MFS transporter [Paludibacterium paludis]
MKPATARLLAPYRSLPRTVYIQLVACLLNNAGGMAKLFLPLYLHERYGIDYRWIGFLVSAYGVGALSGAYLGGALSDRVSATALAKAFMAVSALSMLAMFLPLPLWLFLPLLVISGFSDGAFRPVNQRLALEPCPDARRPVAQGMLRIATNLGVALSGVTGGLIAAHGYQWVYASNGAASLLGALWLALAYRGNSALPEPRRRQDSPAHGTGSPWRDPAFLWLMASLMITIAIFDQMYSSVGLFLKDRYHLPPQWLGYLFTINGAMVVLFQLPVARRVMRWGLGAGAAAGVLFNGLGYLWLLAGQGPLFAVLMAITVTVGELLISPVFSQLVMMRSENRLRGRYLGLYTAVWSGRTIYAPALGTFIYGSWGGSVLWSACAIATLTAVALQTRPVRAILAGHSGTVQT